MILSILIPSVAQHENYLVLLLKELIKQIEPYIGLIEVLVDRHEFDSTGKKRNRLLHQAIGKYVVFIDADDEIQPHYIDEIVKGVKSDCDCMSLSGHMTTDGKNKIGWQLAKDFANETVYRNGQKFYHRKTNHLCPVKRELALQALFPDKSNAEDKEYSERLNSLLQTEYVIGPEMYHYRFSRSNKTYR